MVSSNSAPFKKGNSSGYVPGRPCSLFSGVLKKTVREKISILCPVLMASGWPGLGILGGEKNPDKKPVGGHPVRSFPLVF
jgi:hypothetical protein